MGPRKVTAPGGGVRWQGASGRTFETREAASADAALIVEPTEGAMTALPPSPRAKDKIWAVILGCGYIAVGCGGFWLIYQMVTGLVESKGVVKDTLAFLGAVGMSGGVFAGISALLSARDGRVLDWADRAHALWWRYVFWLIKAALVVVGIGFAYWAITSIFEGLSKGTIIIAFLLFGILLALMDRNKR